MGQEISNDLRFAGVTVERVIAALGEGAQGGGVGEEAERIKSSAIGVTRTACFRGHRSSQSRIFDAIYSITAQVKT